MLLRFSVSNYLSLLNEQSLSLVASKLKAPSEALRFRMGDLEILPSAVIYGPNASGKSNVIAALAFMRQAVLFSHSRGNPSGGVPRIAFAFDPAAATASSTLEVDFTVGGIRYQYGFEANNDRFTAEYLFSFPEGKRRKLFERGEHGITFGPSMKGQKKLLAELMRPNSLFLSTATQNDHEELSTVRAFFADMNINQSIWVGDHIVNSTFSETDIDDRTIEFLKEIGTGVAGYRKNSEEVSDKSREMLAELSAVLRKHISDRDGPGVEIDAGDRQVSIELAHQSRNGALCYLDIDRESAGTRRLLLMINAAFKALDTGGLLVVDEIDASLHTRAAEAIFALFDDAERNRSGAQLIATVHDTNLLASPFLTRDQIWFAEKNYCGESEIFALAEVRTRPTDNLELGYLQGRYGGTIAAPRRRHAAPKQLETVSGEKRG